MDINFVKQTEIALDISLEAYGYKEYIYCDSKST